MNSTSHYSGDIQQKVVRSLLALTAILVIVAVPLVIFDDFRLDIAQRIGVAPGRNAEQLADADDGATLVVLPLGDYDGTGQQRYRYKAEFIGRPVDGGTELTRIDTSDTLVIPLTELEFISSDPDGSHVLFSGPAAGNEDHRAVLVDTQALTAEELPEGQTRPTIAGDWDTPIWVKTGGLCDRYSPEQRFVACFNRADAASYLAGDWQIDIQLFGNYKVVEPVYRGAGFLPMVGFAQHDTWLYFQNELGIWRIEVPHSLQERT